MGNLDEPISVNDLASEEFRKHMKNATKFSFDNYDMDEGEANWFSKILSAVRGTESGTSKILTKEQQKQYSEETIKAFQDQGYIIEGATAKGVKKGMEDSKEEHTIEFTGDYNFETLKADVGFVSKLGTESLNAVAKSYDAAVAAAGYIDDIVAPHRDEFMKMKEAYGGIAQMGSALTNDMGTVVSEAYQTFSKDFFKSSEELQEEGRDLLTFEPTFQLEGLEGVTNELMLYYEDPKDAFKNYAEIVANTSRTYGAEIAKNFKDSAIEISIFSKGLGLSSQQLEKVITRNIDRTGEASVETLRDFNKFAQGVSAATGKSSKMVADTMVAIISDIQNFGNVTDEEASRISGALLEIGIAADTLGKLVGKFSNFDQAASAVGNLTAAFGINLDAMEMMMLANEDQEQFLFRMRDAFEEQGLNFQEMSLSQQKLISSQLGLSLEESARFFDFENEITSLEELKESTEEMSPEDSIKALKSEMISLIDKGGPALQKALEKTKSFGLASNVVDDAIAADRAVSSVIASFKSLEIAANQEISTKVVSVVKDAGKEATDIIEKLNTALKKSKEKISAAEQKNIEEQAAMSGKVMYKTMRKENEKDPLKVEQNTGAVNANPEILENTDGTANLMTTGDGN